MVEQCNADDCKKWAEFTAPDAKQYCKDCYPAPNGGDFSHIPHEGRRLELRGRWEHYYG